MAFVGPMSWHWHRCTIVTSGNYKMVEISDHAGIKFFTENKPIDSQLKFCRLFMGQLVSLNVTSFISAFTRVISYVVCSVSGHGFGKCKKKKCLVLVADSHVTPLGTNYLFTVLCPILRTSMAISLMSYILCIIFYNITLLTNFCALHCVYQITYKFPLWRVSAYTDAVFRRFCLLQLLRMWKWKLVCDLVYTV